MIKYLVTLQDQDSIELRLLNAKRIFKNNEEVIESVYTRYYPMYFKKLGVKEGLSHLAKPTFTKTLVQPVQTIQKEKKVQKVQKVQKVVELEDIIIETEE
jgi:hypothetical protein